MKVAPRSPEAKMPTCKDCFYAREIGSEIAVACRRYPPTITKVEGQSSYIQLSPRQ